MDEQTVYRGYLIDIQNTNPGFMATIEDSMGEEIGSITGTHRGNVEKKAKREVDQSILRKQRQPDYNAQTARKVEVKV